LSEFSTEDFYSQTDREDYFATESLKSREKKSRSEKFHKLVKNTKLLTNAVSQQIFVKDSHKNHGFICKVKVLARKSMKKIKKKIAN
jgi:hypothetical protein